ncbi:MAG: hypothetical protein KIS73_20625 [Enhydrobacter sp.]|jgi:hypothetical protein|nr:hypothetical protein [Enhydrobacter sp.]
MKRTAITEARNGLGDLIRGLRRKAGMLITDRVPAVARPEPAINVPGAPQDSRLLRLVRDGVVQPARSTPGKALFAGRPPKLKRGISAVALVLDERRRGR